jgi:hypothetical protein
MSLMLINNPHWSRSHDLHTLINNIAGLHTDLYYSTSVSLISCRCPKFLQQLHRRKVLNTGLFSIKLKAGHRPTIRLKTDITGNIWKHSAGYGSTIVNFGHERLYTGGCGSLKIYFFIIETDWKITKIQFIYFSVLSTSSLS